MRRLARTAYRALTIHGLTGSLRIARDKWRQPHTPHTVSAFDRDSGLETDGNEDLGELTIPDASRTALLYGERYQPTTPERVHELLAAVPIDFAGSTFIDIGSGKGRVPLVAAAYPFPRLIGLEFASDLTAIAQRNLARRPDPRITFVCADATRYPWPDGPLVLFVANPFRGPIMAAFLAHAEAHPWTVTVLYRNPVESAQWHASRVFRPVVAGPSFEVFQKPD